MTSPDQRAGDGDRKDATRIVDAALASGRIIQADRDKRVEQLQQAQTMQDIDLVVRDLVPGGTTMPVQTAASFGAATVTPVAGQQPQWPQVNYGPGVGQPTELTQVSATINKAGKRIGVVVGIVILVSFLVPIAGVAIALFSARDQLPGPFVDATDETTYAPGQEPGENGINMHYAADYEELVSAVQAELGSTEVYSVVLYPRYAVLDIPVSGGEGRYQSYYYDGELESQSMKSTTTYASFDMAEADPAVFIDLLEKVRAAVDDPTSWYVIINQQNGDEPQYGAYASNEFGESEYMYATFDGTITYDSTTD